MRARTGGLLSLILLLSASGCARVAPAESAVTAIPSPPAATIAWGPAAPPRPLPQIVPEMPGTVSSAIDLIGLWYVVGPLIDVNHRYLALETFLGSADTPCGSASISWAAEAGRMVATPRTWEGGACSAAKMAEHTAWLHMVRGYRPDGDDILLLGADGGIIARLIATTYKRPPGIPEALWDRVGEPRVDDTARMLFTVPPALRADVRAPSEIELLGAWSPVSDVSVGTSGVTFDADGSYVANDGCNEVPGAYVAMPDGRFPSTWGDRSWVECESVDVPTMITQATRVGLDGANLVLFDRDGEEVGRLTRAN